MTFITRIRPLIVAAALVVACSLCALTVEPQRASAAEKNPAAKVLGAFMAGYEFGTWLVQKYPTLGSFAGDWAYETFGD